MGLSNHKDNITNYVEAWSVVHQQEWVHRFILTLDIVPKNWYIELEVHRGTTNWADLSQKFLVTSSFEHDNPNVDVSFQIIK